MTGLENIINQIELDAKSRADEILAKAKSDADKVIADAKAKAEEIINDYSESAVIAAKEAIERSQATDEINAKRAVLGKKQELIKKALDTAKNKIKNSTADEYFDFLENVLNKYALSGAGYVVLAEKDFNEITSSFKAALKEKDLSAKAGNVALRNGFIIVYGNIEINCIIDAIFDSKAEELADSLNGFLWQSEGGV